MKKPYLAAIIVAGLFVPVHAHAQAPAQQDPSAQTPGSATPSTPSQTGAGQSGTTQSGTTQSGTTQTTTTTTSTSTTSSTYPSQTTSGSSQTANRMGSGYQADRFILSGAVGGSFGGDADNGGVALDGTFDWLRHGMYGFEVLGAFSPNFNFGESTLAAASDTQTNSYMFNAIGSAPIGSDANWLPYVSGGIGAITLRNTLDVTANSSANAAFNNSVFNPSGGSTINLIDDNQFAGNVGVGLMGFMNQVGFRFDVRYFSGIGNNDTNSSTTDITSGNTSTNSGVLNSLLQNVSFWRSTVGVSFRW